MCASSRTVVVLPFVPVTWITGTSGSGTVGSGPGSAAATAAAASRTTRAADRRSASPIPRAEARASASAEPRRRPGEGHHDLVGSGARPSPDGQPAHPGLRRDRARERGGDLRHGPAAALRAGAAGGPRHAEGLHRALHAVLAGAQPSRCGHRELHGRPREVHVGPVEDRSSTAVALAGVPMAGRVVSRRRTRDRCLPRSRRSAGVRDTARPWPTPRRRRRGRRLITLKAGDTATGDDAGLQIAELRAARDDEQEDPGEPSAERVGHGDLQDRRTEDRADHVGGAGDRQEHERQGEVVADGAERRDRRTPAHHRPGHRDALPPDPGHGPGRQRLDQRADGRRGEQQPHHGGAATELFHREHREQRLRHPEDHRDEIDHERRLEQSVPGDVREALSHRAHPDRPRLAGQRFGRQRVHRERRDEQAGVAHEVHEVGRRRAADGDQQPCQRGPDDAGRLPQHLVQRDGLRHEVVAHQPRGGRLPGGAVDRGQQPGQQVRTVEQRERRVPADRPGDEHSQTPM